jgi:hypothetical protein
VEKDGAIVENQSTSRTQSPLYLELSAIGSKDRTIRPEALAKYDHLLSCPEVQRRAGLGADRTTLATHAQKALQEAIAGIVTPLTRSVAEAALCAKGYEGLQVTERIHKMPGMTPNIFKYRRQLAFRHIIEFLTQPALAGPYASEDQTGSSSIRTYTFPPYFTIMGNLSAMLHYACMASIFTICFDEELTTNNIRGWSLGSIARRAPLNYYVFENCVRFVYSPINDWLSESQTAKYLATSVIETLQSYSQILADSPIGPRYVEDYQKESLCGHILGGDSRDGTIREVYLAKWQEWYMSVGGPGETSFPTKTAESMAGVSGAFVLLLSRHTGFDEPVKNQARLRAHKAIANCYDIDEWAPIVNGRSLRFQADTFFDSRSPELTNRVLQ